MSTRTLELAARTLAVLAALVVLGGSLLWLSQRPWFAIKRIEVHGDLQHVTDKAIAAALRGKLKGNFFSLPLDEARRVFETVPWVASASIRRGFIRHRNRFSGSRVRLASLAPDDCRR